MALMHATAVGMLYDRATFIAEALIGGLDASKIWQAIGDGHVDAAAATLEGMGKAEASRFLGFANAARKAVQSAFDIWNDAVQLGKSGLPGAMRTLEAQLERVRVKIKEANNALAACGLE